MSSFFAPLSSEATRTGGRSKKQVERRSSDVRTIRFADEKQRRTSAGRIRRSSRLKILEQTLVFDTPDDDDDDESEGSEDSLDQAALAFLGFGGGNGNDDYDYDDDNASFDSFVFAHGGNCNHRGSIQEMDPINTSLEGMAIDFEALNTSRSSLTFNEKDMLGNMLRENMASIRECEETRLELEAELEAIKTRASENRSAGSSSAASARGHLTPTESGIMGDPELLKEKIEQELKALHKSSLVSGHLSSILERTLAILILQKVARGFLIRRDVSELKQKVNQLEHQLAEIKRRKSQELQELAEDPELLALREEWEKVQETMTAKATFRAPSIDGEDWLSTKESLQAMIAVELQIRDRHLNNMNTLKTHSQQCQVNLDYINEEVGNMQKRVDKLQDKQSQLQEQLYDHGDAIDEVEAHIVAVQESRRNEKRKVQRTKKYFSKLVKTIREYPNPTGDKYVTRLQRRAMILEKIKAQYREEQALQEEEAAAAAVAEKTLLTLSEEELPTYREDSDLQVDTQEKVQATDATDRVLSDQDDESAYVDNPQEPK